MIDRHRTTRVVVLLIAFVVAGCAGTVASEAPAHATAAEACRAADGGSWEVDVQVDRADASALAMVSDGQLATCLTYRDGAGFGSASVGVGAHPNASPNALSYLSGQVAGAEAILVGRYPTEAAAIRVTLRDGSSHEASLGRGLWLAWVSSDSEPVLIEALDPSGDVIDRLANPHGLQPRDR